MICCPETSALANTPRSKFLVKVLRGLFLLQTVIMIFIFIFQSEFEGIFELMHMIILYCAFHNVNPCYCVVYIFMGLMKQFQILVWFGLMLQNGYPFFRRDNIQINGLTILNLSSLVFYIVAILYTFLAYREFKALEIENQRNMLSDSGASYENYRVDYQNNAVVPADNRAAPDQNERGSINPEIPNNVRVPVNSLMDPRQENLAQLRAEELNHFQSQYNQAYNDRNEQRNLSHFQESRPQDLSRENQEFYSFQGNQNLVPNQSKENPKAKAENEGPVDQVADNYIVSPLKKEQTNDEKVEILESNDSPQKKEDDGLPKVILNNKVFTVFQGQGIVIGGGD